MIYILSFLVFLRKVFDWFMALSPSQQFAIARGVIKFINWLNKSYHSWITWCKHWYDTRHQLKNGNEYHVDNKKEQHHVQIMLFLLLLYVTVLIILIVK